MLHLMINRDVNHYLFFVFELLFAMDFSNQRRGCAILFSACGMHNLLVALISQPTKYVQQVARAFALVLSLFTSIPFFYIYFLCSQSAYLHHDIHICV